MKAKKTKASSTTAPSEKHYVTFYSPGSFMSETTTKSIESWSTMRARQMASEITERYGSKPYSFVFTTRLEQETVAGTASKELRRSGQYYLDAKLETYDELAARNLEDEEILRSNMEGNSWPIIVTNGAGSKTYRWSQPFDSGDAIVNAVGDIVVTGLDPLYVMYRELQNLAFKAYYEDKYPHIFKKTVDSKGVPA